MTNRIVGALEHAATRLGKTLGEDAGKAVGDLYHSTGHNLTGIAEDTTAADLKHETALRGLMRDTEQPPVHAPHDVSDTGHLPHQQGDEPPLGGEHAPGQPSEGNGSCTTGGDPVDVVSGQMITSATDIDLPGLLPVVLRRAYASGYTGGRWFGPGWTSTLDQRVQIDAEGIHYAGEDAEIQHYPLPTDQQPSVLPIRGPQRPLTWDRDADTIRIEDTATGVTRYFATPPAPGAQTRTITALTDRNGHRIDYLAGPDGLPAEVRHTGGYRIAVDITRTLTGPRIGGLRLIHDGTSTQILQYGYDGRGRLTALTDSTGLPLTYAYDDHDRITSWTDRNNHWYAYEYGPDGRVTRGHGPQGALEAQFQYDRANRTTTVTNSLGHATTYHYDRHGHLTQTVDPLGGTVHTTYDPFGRLLSRIDELGRATRYTLGPNGERLRIDRPDGTFLAARYDAHALPVQIFGPDGATWQQAYDAAGNRTEVTDPAGAVTRYTYDDSGRLTAVTNALGHTTTVVCDRVGLPIQVTDPLGASAHYRRDAFGRVTHITDPLGKTTSFTWTTEGKPLTRTSPDGSTERRTYDAEGNCLAYTDAAGGVTRYEYTHFAQPVARIGPDGARWVFAHDTELRLRSVVNTQGLSWTYDYDPAGRLTAETDFDGRTLTYSHDEAGRLTARADPIGEMQFGHDVLGRLTARTAAGTRTTFAYDAAGRLLQATGPDATLTYQRDRLGRVTSETCNGRTLTYTYDALGRCTSRTTPMGVTSTSSYDAAGNRTALAAAGHLLQFAYDAASRETTRLFGAATVVDSEFDALGRLSAQSLTSDGRRVHHRSYTYRADSSLLAVEDDFGGLRTFNLDPAGRVSTVRADGWTERYAYDSDGNQTDASWPAAHGAEEATGPRTYNGTRITQAGRIRYEHDANGRVTLRRKTRISRKPDTWVYAWDAEDRLTQVTTPDGTVWRYRYDPLGRRIAKERLTPDGETAETTHFAWDGPTLVEQTSMGGTLPQPVTLTWDHDGVRPLVQIERISAADAPQDVIDERFFAIVSDLVGTPTELVDDTGRIAWRARSTLWGATSWPSDSTAYTPLRFPGQYFDAESGLHYNVFRLYDPETARYTAPDPLGLAPAPNPVAYVDNPHTAADPLGLACYDVERVPEDELSTLFHYTNESGHDAIVESEELWPSLKEHNPKDARFGDGQYLSNIQPGSKTPGQLSYAFLRVPYAGRKYTHYVEIDVRGLEVMRSVERPDVFVIPNSGNLDLAGRIVSHGKN